MDAIYERRCGLDIHKRTLGRGRGTYLAARYRRLTARRGKKKAAVALGHSVLVIVYHLLSRRPTVLDGEIVIADEEGRADFGALQRRLGVASRRSSQVPMPCGHHRGMKNRVPRLAPRSFSEEAAANCPAILLVFDMLDCAATDFMQLPLIGR